MRSSELAALAGVNVQTLRYYERIGLLPEPVRTPVGYREYGDGSLRRLRFVRRAKELGFQLDEVRELLEIADHDARDHQDEDDQGAAGCAEVRELAVHRVADLERRIADLTRMRDSLGALADSCPSCHGVEVTADACPVIEALDEES